MRDALLIMNAGSSSLKFSVFLDGKEPILLLRGQFEELTKHPHFAVQDATGNVVEKREWKAGEKLGHFKAIEFLFEWGRNGKLSGHTIAAVGHRIVHGGVKFAKPVRSIVRFLRNWKNSFRWRLFISRIV